MAHVEVRGQVVGVSSLLQACGSQGLNLESGLSTGCPLPAEPSHRQAKELSLVLSLCVTSEETEAGAGAAIPEAPWQRQQSQHLTSKIGVGNMQGLACRGRCRNSRG